MVLIISIAGISHLYKKVTMKLMNLKTQNVQHLKKEIKRGQRKKIINSTQNIICIIYVFIFRYDKFNNDDLELKEILKFSTIWKQILLKNSKSIENAGSEIGINFTQDEITVMRDRLPRKECN